jgi:hypothetical protein
VGGIVDMLVKVGELKEGDGVSDVFLLVFVCSVCTVDAKGRLGAEGDGRGSKVRDQDGDVRCEIWRGG